MMVDFTRSLTIGRACRCAVVVTVGLALACNAEQPDSTPPGGLTTGALSNTGPATSGADGPATEATSQGSGPGDGTVGDDSAGVKFDVGDDSFCTSKEEGIFCDEQTAVVCDANGEIAEETLCAPESCLAGEGCVTCLADQWTCKGPRVMQCNTQAQAYWEEVEVCDPAAQEYCDISSAGCSVLTPIGDVTPTGEYYLYSTFAPSADGFTFVSDVDSHDDRIWFVGYLAGQLVVGAYQVTLLDSDGDGLIEPHQHPDYPDEQGPIEQRVFTLVDSFAISNDGAVPHQMELSATATTLTWAGPFQITQYDLATGVSSMVAPAPPWLAGLQYKYLAFLGYDDVNGVWYSGNESARRVFQYDAETATWGYAFEFPALAGDHMDGMDVVTDPRTGIPYVYVSDMTSNYIGQYRHDPEEGWVQENMFSYAEANGAPVEGFGFGALSHFWVGGWEQNSFYEIGGGDLTEYLDPEG